MHPTELYRVKVCTMVAAKESGLNRSTRITDNCHLMDAAPNTASDTPLGDVHRD